MSTCRCGHNRVLHNPEGPCLALVMVAYATRCGCPEYRRDEVASKAEKTR